MSDYSAAQIAIAIRIKEALEGALDGSTPFEWNKGLCNYIRKQINHVEQGLLEGTYFLRYCEILYDAMYSWKEYSGNPCYPIHLVTHKGSPSTQWELVHSKQASQALQVNYEAKRKQLATHIVATLKEKYCV